MANRVADMVSELQAFERLAHTWNTKGEAAFRRDFEVCGFKLDPAIPPSPDEIISPGEIILEGRVFRAFFYGHDVTGDRRPLNAAWPEDGQLYLATCSLAEPPPAAPVLDCMFMGVRRDGEPVWILSANELLGRSSARLPCAADTARRLFETAHYFEPESVPADSWGLFADAVTAYNRAFAAAPM